MRVETKYKKEVEGAIIELNVKEVKAIKAALKTYIATKSCDYSRSEKDCFKCICCDLRDELEEIKDED